MMKKHHLPLQWLRYMNGGGPGSDVCSITLLDHSKYTEFLPIIQIALARQKLDEASTLDEYCAATGSWGPFDSLAFAHRLTQSEDDNLRTYVREIYWFTYEVTIEEAAKRFKDPERLRQGWSF